MKRFASFVILAVILAAPVSVSAAQVAPTVNFKLGEAGFYYCADGSLYSSYGPNLGGRLSVYEFYRRLACAKGDKSLYQPPIGK